MNFDSSSQSPAEAADAPDPPAPAALETLRQVSAAESVGKPLGQSVAAARDALARRLVDLGIRPNVITVAGLFMTCGAAYGLARGAGQQVPYFVGVRDAPVGWWPTWTLAFLFLAAACDMLDGAVARVGNLRTRAGAVLDSTIDRLSDMALYIGCLLYFAQRDPANLTYQLLAVLSLCCAVLISYIKARAECLIDNCSVGYWSRGERFAGLMIACACGHVPAYLWQMSFSCAFTVWRRASYAYRALRALDTGRALPTRGPAPGWLGALQIWRSPRGSLGYDVATGLHIVFVVVAPCVWPALQGVGPWGDPLRRWLLS